MSTNTDKEIDLPAPAAPKVDTKSQRTTQTQQNVPPKKDASKPILIAALIAAIVAGVAYWIYEYGIKPKKGIGLVSAKDAPRNDLFDTTFLPSHPRRRDKDGNLLPLGDDWIVPDKKVVKAEWKLLPPTVPTATLNLLEVSPNDLMFSSPIGSDSGLSLPIFPTTTNTKSTAPWGMSDFLGGDASYADLGIDPMLNYTVPAFGAPTNYAADEPGVGPGVQQSTPPAQTQKTPSEIEMQNWIISRYSQDPVDLAKRNCADGSNAIFVGGLAPSSNPPVDELTGRFGYCVRKCEYARSEQDRVGVSGVNTSTVYDSSKFNNEMVGGKYKVEYELVLWINPASNKALKGYRWYCRAKSPAGDYTWSINETGFYHRKAISPIFLSSNLDTFVDKIGLWLGPTEKKKDAWTYPKHIGYDMARDSDAYRAMYTQLCASNDPEAVNPKHRVRKNYDRLTHNGGKAYIGKRNNDYLYFDYQMIGSYCYWVGHDSYSGGNGDVIDNEFHGDFSKVPLRVGMCEKYTYKSRNVLANGKNEIYNMRSTPGGLQCYACPSMYEAVDGAVVEIKTLLKGTDDEGYKCVRPCPTEMYDTLSPVGMDWCLPGAVEMVEFTASDQMVETPTPTKGE